jgi:hypothetical protein
VIAGRTSPEGRPGQGVTPIQVLPGPSRAARNASGASSSGKLARRILAGDGMAELGVAVNGSFCFFRMSNRYSFGAIFGVDLLDTARRDHYRKVAGDMVVSCRPAPPDPA